MGDQKRKIWAGHTKRERKTRKDWPKDLGKGICPAVGLMS